MPALRIGATVEPESPPGRALACGAVMLAAGAGSRLGSRPKSLLELGGVALIRRQLDALLTVGVQPIAVVLGHHADAIEAALRGVPATVVRNLSPDDGQSSSVRLGLQALPENLDAIFIALADQPMITAPDLAELIDAFTKRGDAAMTVPRVAGVPGNPVIITGALRDEWLASDIHSVGRAWREANPTRLHWFNSGNPHYCLDIDTPEDITGFNERSGHQLRWPT